MPAAEPGVPQWRQWGVGSLGLGPRIASVVAGRGLVTMGNVWDARDRLDVDLWGVAWGLSDGEAQRFERVSENYFARHGLVIGEAELP